MCPVTSRAVTVGLGAAYVAASALGPLVLKTTPSDLDVFFWPAAETAVSGHPLLIYSTVLHGNFFMDNGPLGLVPLVPVVALANALGWAGSLTGRAALAGAVVSLFALLLAYQAVRFTTSARGHLRWSLAVACTVLLAPALWIGVLDYGHIEQPLELCLVLLAVAWFRSSGNALTGVALGLAALTRTIAGLCAIPIVLAQIAARRGRPAAVTTVTAAITVLVILVPFLLADGPAVTHSLFTNRGSLPIEGGSFWVVARQASWSGLVEHVDAYLGAAVAIVLVAVTLRRRPGVATTQAGLMGLVTVASCCVPLFAKTDFPYYLLEPYVFAVLWWLARPGDSRNWRGVVPLLLTIDVFVVKAALLSPFSIGGVVAGVSSSVIVATATALVMVDLLHAPANAVAPRMSRQGSHQQGVAEGREAK
jgi:hypothetical protein